MGVKTNWQTFYIKKLCLYMFITLNSKLKSIHLFYLLLFNRKKELFDGVICVSYKARHIYSITISPYTQ